MGDGGKGDRPRPISVSQAEYDNRWDAIFARDLTKEECAQCNSTGQATQATTDTRGVESPEYASVSCPNCSKG